VTEQPELNQNVPAQAVPIVAQDEASGKRPPRSVAHGLLKLARPHQWSKSGFVLLGPLYGAHDIMLEPRQAAVAAVATAASFALVSSACYAVNDIIDAPRDRFHPRKMHRPVASGVVSSGLAWVFAVVVGLVGLGLMALVPTPGMWWGLGMVVAYAINVTVYSVWMKNVRIADVLGLSMGFVLRVVGGCVAVGIWPSAWLMNVTLFLAMFLAFGKRLGERRAMGSDALVAQVRQVQERYTSELLRMAVVVTGVATLMTYAAYVQDQTDFIAFTGAFAGFGEREIPGFNLLWLTMLPATYGLLRCIVLLEQGVYDDPTELAFKDLPFQVAAGAFVLSSLGLIFFLRILDAQILGVQ
jgi:decaprenyl-phosphate phosphoribosyltransferase